MKYLRYGLLVACMVSGVLFAQQTPPERDFATPAGHAPSPVRAAAERALQQWTARFGEQAAAPGFPLQVHKPGELGKLRLGWGFQVYDVQPASLAGGASLEDDAQPTGIWRYAILVQGRTVGLLTMARTAQGWQAVSIGGAGLGQDIAAAVAAFGAQPGTRLRYVRVPQATADFIEVKRGHAAARFAPLHAARASLHLAAPAASRLLEERDLRPGLRQAVARNTALMH